MAKLIEASFSAWIDNMPNAGKPLHVTGKAQVPTLGWSGRIEKIQPQGFNPSILLLSVVLVAPEGGAGDALSEIDLNFIEQPAQQPYTQVEIQYESASVVVSVGDTQ